jgi:hypothetical protein
MFVIQLHQQFPQTFKYLTKKTVHIIWQNGEDIVLIGIQAQPCLTFKGLGQALETTTNIG